MAQKCFHVKQTTMLVYLWSNPEHPWKSRASPTLEIRPLVLCIPEEHFMGIAGVKCLRKTREKRF